jgi:hypothetical protein
MGVRYGNLIKNARVHRPLYERKSLELDQPELGIRVVLRPPMPLEYTLPLTLTRTPAW